VRACTFSFFFSLAYPSYTWGNQHTTTTTTTTVPTYTHIQERRRVERDSPEHKQTHRDTTIESNQISSTFFITFYITFPQSLISALKVGSIESLIPWLIVGCVSQRRSIY
jgi:hypothetical protein